MIDLFYKDLNICLNNSEELYKYHGLLNLFLLNHNINNDITNYSKKRNSAYIKEANKLSYILNQNGIKHAFLKSTSILTELYPNIAIKRFGDIDILIDKSQLNLVEDIVFDLNYQYGTYNYTTGEIIKATREEVITRQMFSHQTYELCKRQKNTTYNLDIKQRKIT